jgi:hypothetical protein
MRDTERHAVCSTGSIAEVLFCVEVRDGGALPRLFERLTRTPLVPATVECYNLQGAIEVVISSSNHQVVH